MDFDLSDEQRLLQETVAQFMDNECPLARIRELYDDEVGFDPVLWKGLAELGLAGIHLPGEYGGSELEILDLAVVAETLGSRAAPVPFLSHSLASLAILLAGNADQKSRWLPGLASGELLATVALAEEGGGWLPEDWTLQAGAAISGTKEIVEFGEHADLFVVGLAGGRFGALVPVGDVDAVARALMQALDSPPDRERLRAHGAEFGADRAADAYLAAVGLPEHPEDASR